VCVCVCVSECACVWKRVCVAVYTSAIVFAIDQTASEKMYEQLDLSMLIGHTIE